VDAIRLGRNYEYVQSSREAMVLDTKALLSLKERG
jgi:formate hydrogenlyase subunit 6/NADH:ubiquinone oxidoreductase subunit I